MKKYVLLFTLFLSFGLSFAQTKDSLSVEEQEKRKRNIEAGNPFKKFGYTPKIATLSKGKYLEWHDLDSIVRIGSYSFHVKKKDITGYNTDEDKNSEATLRPELTSRWLSPDPLAEEFPSWSPYNYVMNNPIRYTDPTGMAPEEVDGIDTDIFKVYKNKDGTYRAEKWQHINDGKNEQMFLIMGDNGGATEMYQGKEAQLDMSKAGIKLKSIDYGTTTLGETKDAIVRFWTSDDNKDARETMLAYTTFVIPFEGIAVGMLGQTVKGGKSAFDIAKTGGKHSGFLKNYTGRSPDEINKAIKSMQSGKEGISVHLDKIANPTKYVPNWNTLRPGHQQSLIKGWQNTVTKHTEQIQILKGILGN